MIQDGYDSNEHPYSNILSCISLKHTYVSYSCCMIFICGFAIISFSLSSFDLISFHPPAISFHPPVSSIFSLPRSGFGIRGIQLILQMKLKTRQESVAPKIASVGLQNARCASTKLMVLANVCFSRTRHKW